MKKAALILCIFFTGLCFGQTPKTKISMARVEHYVKRIDSICTKPGKRKIYFSLRNSEFNYYSPSNVMALHTIKLSIKKATAVKPTSINTRKTE